MNSLPIAGSAVASSIARFHAIVRSAALLVFLSACQAAFAPAYDPALVAGFNQSNERALALFSALAGGSSAGAYPSHAAQYDEVIGAFEALKLQAEARPSPPLPPAVAARLTTELCSDPAACANNPTPFNLAGIVSNLNLMKARHAGVGLTSNYVELRKLDHEVYAANVLVVEEYLKRN